MGEFGRGCERGSGAIGRALPAVRGSREAQMFVGLRPTDCKAGSARPTVHIHGVACVGELGNQFQRAFANDRTQRQSS